MPTTIVKSTNASRPSLRSAIDEWCRGCVYQKEERGTWREQVAACGAGDKCPLYRVRPVPRHCVQNGIIDPVPIAKIEAKLAQPK